MTKHRGDHVDQGSPTCKERHGKESAVHIAINGARYGVVLGRGDARDAHSRKPCHRPRLDLRQDFLLCLALKASVPEPPPPAPAPSKQPAVIYDSAAVILGSREADNGAALESVESLWHVMHLG